MRQLRDETIRVRQPRDAQQFFKVPRYVVAELRFDPTMV